MQRFLVALLTILVFAAGFGARVWTEQASAVPPPPATAGIEFTPKGTDAPRGGAFRMSRTQIISAIEQNGKQSEAYRARVDQLDKEFEAKFVPLLTATQKQLFSEEQKKQSDMVARIKAATSSTETLTDDQVDRLRNNPLQNVLRMIQPKERADRLDSIYSLSDDQHATVLGMLNDRRDQFLKLVDETPFPSIRYSELAPLVERIANPAILKAEAEERQERQDRDKAKKVEDAKKTEVKK